MFGCSLATSAEEGFKVKEVRRRRRRMHKMVIIVMTRDE